MVETQAKVISVGQDTVNVIAMRASACGGCQSSESCGTSSLAKLFVRKHVELCLPKTVDVTVGDEVVLGMSETAFVKQLMLAYFPPLLLMMLCAGLAHSAHLNDVAQTMSGLIGLFGGFMLTRVLRKRISQVGDQPQIIRKQGDSVYE